VKNRSNSKQSVEYDSNKREAGMKKKLEIITKCGNSVYCLELKLLQINMTRN
jgi:hypothetical protein